MVSKFEQFASVLRSWHSTTYGGGVSEDELGVAESALAVTIRGEYRQFLAEFGWANIVWYELYGLGCEPRNELVRNARWEWVEAGLPLPRYLLPINNDGGGNSYCLDLRGKGEPPVVFWIHDAGADQALEHLASSFCSWVTAELFVPED